MNLSASIFSDDSFFTLAINALLSHELIDDKIYIVDIKTSTYTQVMILSSVGKKVFVFISNDIDFYALKCLENVILLDRNIAINEMMSTFLVDSSLFNYHAKHKLAARESDMLICMLKGLDMREISERLKISLKIFYACRTRMLNKLQMTNRIFLYKHIAKHTEIV